MAERYRHEPIAVSSAGALLFLLALPLGTAALLGIVRGLSGALLVSGVGFLAYLYAAFLTRQSLRREQAFLERRFSQAPSLWDKKAAALIVALTTFFVALFGAGQPLFIGLILAAVAFVGFTLSYGFGARRQLRNEIDVASDDPDVRAALEEAEAKIAGIERAAAEINSPKLAGRLSRVAAAARAMLIDLAADPKDIRRARKFLYVYLDGAQRVAGGYADNQERSAEAGLEARFEQVLETIETTFKAQRERLAEDDLFDLDVQIEVLQTQLKNDGVL